MSDSYSTLIDVYRQLTSNKPRMKENFQKLDTDRDECLSQSEFRQLLSKMDIVLNDKDLAYIFNRNASHGRLRYADLSRDLKEYAKSDLSQTMNLQDTSMSEYGADGGTRLRTIRDMNIPKNYSMNAYTHISRQNVSRIEDSFSESQAFPTSVFRSGHIIQPSERRSNASDTSTSVLSALPSYSFRTNLEYIHKNVVVSSLFAISEEVIRSFFAAMQQELIKVASLRHSSFFPVMDSDSSYKYVLMMVWMPRSYINGTVESVFGKEAWRDVCNKHVNSYGLKCDWMIDIHPDYCIDKLLVYCRVC
ncbi:uncharacterized protein [Blastocystis hominis]|uniref:EF-hand domain-containing protein n=1 Tax=Blastocystis hominis TaxID=12968 RepID=D8LWZ5_BLAHO|nr:uncharacterized protein [Blastocystis hominis]CBK20790.2 unnamed protein product [Blastocystis hominis]|eukprot:XP_012894838.1 uncharacterized protein [Blastocystis hominis]